MESTNQTENIYLREGYISFQFYGRLNWPEISSGWVADSDRTADANVNFTPEFWENLRAIILEDLYIHGDIRQCWEHRPAWSSWLLFESIYLN